MIETPPIEAHDIRTFREDRDERVLAVYCVTCVQRLGAIDLGHWWVTPERRREFVRECVDGHVLPPICWHAPPAGD